MDGETRSMLNTLLILLVALLQFVLRRGPQSQQVAKLEERLTQVEQQLSSLQQPPTSH